MTTTAVAGMTEYSAYWNGQIARRYNRDGPDGVRDRRHRAGTAAPLLGEGLGAGDAAREGSCCAVGT